MLSYGEERRKIPGVAVLAATRPMIISTLEAAAVPYRALLVQDDYALPKVRPPIVLDTAEFSTLELAQILCNFNAGRMEGWTAGKPLPVIAFVRPHDYAHHRLLATSAAVVAVMGAPVDPYGFAVYLRRFANEADDQEREEQEAQKLQSADTATLRAARKRRVATHSCKIWFGSVTDPALPQTCPDRAKLLTILAGAAKLQDVSDAYSLSRSSFFRFMKVVCDTLAIPRPTTAQSAERWRMTLLDALDAPPHSTPLLPSTTVLTPK